MSNTKKKIEFAVEVKGKIIPVVNRDAARASKRSLKAEGIKAKIIRNEYTLVNTTVVR